MMILGLVIIGAIVYMFYNNNSGFVSEKHSKNKSIETLKRRYANGEIDDEAYMRMLKIIND